MTMMSTGPTSSLLASIMSPFAVPSTSSRSVFAVELTREELEGRLRLRLLLAGQVQALLGQVGPRLQHHVEHLRRSAPRRELEDPRPVGIQPQLGHQLATVTGRRDLELEDEHGTQHREVVQLDSRGGVLGVERALLLGEEL